MGTNELNEGDNFGEKLPVFAHDGNNHSAPILMGAIVEDGVITKYLPVNCRDNGDGTCTPYYLLDT